MEHYNHTDLPHYFANEKRPFFHLLGCSKVNRSRVCCYSSDPRSSDIICRAASLSDHGALRVLNAKTVRGSYRSDVCRAAVLAREGGFYTDLDVATGRHYEGQVGFLKEKVQ